MPGWRELLHSQAREKYPREEAIRERKNRHVAGHRLRISSLAEQSKIPDRQTYGQEERYIWVGVGDALKDEQSEDRAMAWRHIVWLEHPERCATSRQQGR